MFKKALLFVLAFTLIFSLAYASDKVLQEKPAKIEKGMRVKFITPEQEKAVPIARERATSLKGVFDDGIVQSDGMQSWKEDFEGSFPGPWNLSWQNSWWLPGYGYTWGKTTNNPYNGNYAGWCVEDNYRGMPDLDAGVDNYPNYTKAKMSRLFYPLPENKKWIKLEFMIDMDVEYWYDYLRVYVDAYDYNWNFYWGSWKLSGTTGGYVSVVIDLSAIGPAEDFVDLLVEFYFKSDLSITGPGVWLDDIKVKVHYWDPVFAVFTTDVIAGKAPLTVQFENLCGGVPNHFLWDFGDGQTLELDEGWPDYTNPVHTYNAGEYTVTLDAWRNGGADTYQLPNLIYADADFDYLPLEFISGSETVAGAGWENAIDSDLTNSLMAVADGAEAVFKVDPNLTIDKIRILTRSIGDHIYTTDFLGEFEIYASADGIETGECICDDACVEKHGEWDEFDVVDPCQANYLIVKLNSSQGGNAPNRELAELQIFGTVDGLAQGQPAAEIASDAGSFTATDLPAEFKLAQNYPNPFNPETNISFDLPEDADVTLEIYNLQGQLINTLINGNLTAGFHNYSWNATNSAGQKVAGGVYIYKLSASNASQTASLTSKMILMK